MVKFSVTTTKFHSIPMYSNDQSIVNIFESQCEKHPNRTALMHEDGRNSVTYYELNARANILAKKLISFIYVPDENGHVALNPTVSVMTERTVGMVVAIL
eukprot:gene13010-27452_t